MKQLGLTGVSADTLVEATQQLESRESESTTTPTDGTDEVKSGKSRSEGMFMPVAATECIQLAESEPLSPHPSRIPKTAKPSSNVSQLLPSFFFLSSGVEW